jgi:hypothetical protein
MKTNQVITKILITKENSVNPFLRNFHYRISFKTWFRESKYRLKSKAVLLLENSGNIDIVDMTKLEFHKRKVSKVEVIDEDYFSATSDEDI